MFVDWADLYARANLALSHFRLLFSGLTPLWLLGLFSAASASWLLQPWLSRYFGLSSPASHPRRWPVQLLGGIFLGLLSPFPLLSLAPTLAELAKLSRARPFALGVILASVMSSPAALAFGWAAIGGRLALLQVGAALALAGAIGSLLVTSRPEAVLRSTEDNRSLPPGNEPRTFVGYLRWLGRQLRAVGPHYLFALLLSAWLSALLPIGPLASRLKSLGPLLVPIAALVGGVVHQCAATAPVVAELFGQAGLPLGAVMSYLTFGQVSAVRNVVALCYLFKARGMILVLGLSLAGAIILGLVVNP
ncbi:MAG: permease [Chloroflexi bacterium]|nr:permease [Chloroflexota bacterium]